MSVDLKSKLVNEMSRMSQLRGPFAIALPVTLDQAFVVSQNGETIGNIVANKIMVGGAGNLALEMAYTLNNLPVISFVRGAIAGQIIEANVLRVLSVSALGNTTATNLTWMSGE